jgi:hypothetical protein
MANFGDWFRQFLLVKENTKEYERLVLKISLLRINFDPTELATYEKYAGVALTDTKMLSMIMDPYLRQHLIQCFQTHCRISYSIPILVKLVTHFPEIGPTAGIFVEEPHNMYLWSFESIKPILNYFSDEKLEDYLISKTSRGSHTYGEINKYIKYMYPLIKDKDIKIFVLVHMQRYLRDYSYLDKDSSLLARVNLYYCDIMGYTRFDEKALIDIVASYF